MIHILCYLALGVVFYCAAVKGWLKDPFGHDREFVSEDAIETDFTAIFWLCGPFWPIGACIYVICVVSSTFDHACNRIAFHRPLYKLAKFVRGDKNDCR